jgi:hypothetical protein
MSIPGRPAINLSAGTCGPGCRTVTPRRCSPNTASRLTTCAYRCAHRFTPLFLDAARAKPTRAGDRWLVGESYL